MKARATCFRDGTLACTFCHCASPRVLTFLSSAWCAAFFCSSRSSCSSRSARASRSFHSAFSRQASARRSSVFRDFLRELSRRDSRGSHSRDLLRSGRSPSRLALGDHRGADRVSVCRRRAYCCESCRGGREGRCPSRRGSARGGRQALPPRLDDLYWVGRQRLRR